MSIGCKFRNYEKEIAVNLKEIPTQNSKGNSMARCWKMLEYDSTVCTDMRKSIKTTQEVPGTTVIAFETHTLQRASQPSGFIKTLGKIGGCGEKPPT